MVPRALLLLSVLASCDPNAGPADAGPDADADRALVFEFETKPEIPGRAGGSYDARIEAATFTLRDLRAVGDASPGGELTARDEVVLSWPGGIDELGFAGAPPGRYAHFLFAVAAYRLEGTLELDGDAAPFVLEDAPPTPISIALDLDEIEHEGTEVTDVEIEIDLRRLVNAVEWESVEQDQEGLRVDASSSQIEAVRDRLPGAFEVDD